jgi:release factor glutamine methyltransferase
MARAFGGKFDTAAHGFLVFHGCKVRHGNSKLSSFCSKSTNPYREAPLNRRIFIAVSLNQRMKIASIVKMYRQELGTIYPEREIDQLISYAFEKVMNLSKVQVHMNGDDEIEIDAVKEFYSILERLKKSEPIQYILGGSVFYGLPLKLNSSVLIPRPETEELVHWILNTKLPEKARMIDLGTGSGCIALALADRMKDASIFGADKSVDALNLANENARKNNLQVEFFHFDILRRESLGFMRFDLMVSNPPYVRSSEMDLMHDNVIQYEPHEALFVYGEDPLLFYRRIIDLADGHLKRGGYLFFEINEAFGNDLVQLMRDRGYEEIELKKDFSGRDRMIRAKRP